MKTVTLRTLVREPLKVKRMTRSGQAVQVTDRGEPLWVLRPAAGTPSDQAERDREIDDLLDELLRSPRAEISLSKIVVDSRR